MVTVIAIFADMAPYFFVLKINCPFLIFRINKLSNLLSGIPGIGWFFTPNFFIITGIVLLWPITRITFPTSLCTLIFSNRSLPVVSAR